MISFKKQVTIDLHILLGIITALIIIGLLNILDNIIDALKKIYDQKEELSGE